MMIFYALCLLSIVNANSVHDASLSFISALIGEERVISTFQSLDFLRSSMMLENERDSTASMNDPQSKRHRVACFDYEKGQAFADASRKIYKEEEVSAAIPILVDYDNDLMCFTIKVASVLKKHLKMESTITTFEAVWDHPIPVALKIHHSIYDTIDNLSKHIPSEESNATFFTMFVRNITIGDGSSSGLSQELKAKISQLAQYDLSSAQDFFWTSPRSLALLTTAQSLTAHSLDVQMDTSRMTLWHSLSQALGFKVKELDALGMADPCLLADIRIDEFEHRVSINVAHLLRFNESDEVQAISAACLVYLSAVFAEDPSTVQLSLTAPPDLLNVRVRSIEQSNVIDVSLTSGVFSRAGLLGDNQIVSFADTGLDQTHCMFSDASGSVIGGTIALPVASPSFRKVISYTSGFSGCDYGDEVGGHGTHVGGTIAGKVPAALNSPASLYNGVAPNAKLMVMDLGNPGTGLYVCSASCLYSFPLATGARIHTNSWGSLYTGKQYYSSSDVDLFLFNHPELIIFFAAGNSGTNGPSSITMEGSAKNIVTVGASETTLGSLDIRNVAWFSSIGPTYDGRIKPDILAPGDAVESAASNSKGGASCGTVSKSGTSMASPAAAGAAALVRQFFIDRSSRFWSKVCRASYKLCRGFTPSGVLVKAVMLHSGTRMKAFWLGDNIAALKTAPPDNYQGYGLLSLSTVLPLAAASFDLFVDDLRSIGQNAIVSYTVTVSSAKTPLKVTVSWYDYPAADGTTTPALINNLDLEVVSLNANVRLHGNLGASALFDKVNNNEQVFVANPMVGEWQVVVSSHALPHSGSQLFSIVITSGGVVTAH